MKNLTIEQQRIKIQIEAGFGFYGGKYRVAKTEKEKQEILNALASAAGFLRNELAKRLRLRRIPELSFYWDDSIERGSHVLELIDQVSTSQTPE